MDFPRELFCVWGKALRSTSLLYSGANVADMMESYEFKFRAYAHALYYALQEDAFYITMEKSVTQGDPREAMMRYMDYSIREGESYGEIVIPDGDYGVSVWSLPVSDAVQAEKFERKKAFLEEYMGEASAKTYADICDSMDSFTAPLVPSDAWYLSILGILPARQGKGLGPGLLQGMLDRADQAGVSTFLETFTPRNMSFYERLGYESRGRFNEPVTGSDYWVMVRPPA